MAPPLSRFALACGPLLSSWALLACDEAPPPPPPIAGDPAPSAAASTAAAATAAPSATVAAAPAPEAVPEASASAAAAPPSSAAPLAAPGATAAAPRSGTVAEPAAPAASAAPAVAAAPQGPVVGKPWQVVASAQADAGYHCNDAYPHKFTTSGGTNVTYPDPKPRGACAGDAVAVTVPFVPTAAGPGTVSGTLSYGICDAAKTSCLMKKKEVTLSFVASAP